MVAVILYWMGHAKFEPAEMNLDNDYKTTHKPVAMQLRWMIAHVHFAITHFGYISHSEAIALWYTDSY